MSLNDKQKKFVSEYVKDCNATQAAIRAGYSKKTAQEQSSRLLSNVIVRVEIDKKIKKAADSSEITVERTLRELSRLAFFDIRKLVNPDGSPKPIQDLDDDTAAAIGGLDILEEFEGTGKDRKFIGYTKKYKITDKNSAIEKSMKYLKLLTDKFEHTGKDGKDLVIDDTELAKRVAFMLTAAVK